MPRLFVMIETEIWPNLLRECRRRGVHTVLVNGRISYRSFPRYRLIRPFFRRVLADVDRLCVQGDEAARRLALLGADPSRITVTGSLKFDSLDVTPKAGRGRERVLRFFRMSSNRPVLVAGSTARGEEEADHPRVQPAAYRRQQRAARARAAPSGAVRRGRAALPARKGCPRSAARELAIDAEPRADAVVLDTIGELAEVYQIATVVFVGGSLVPAGGHNILEPAAFGKPIVFGPHMENFAEIAEAFLANDAAVQVRSERELDDGDSSA